MGVAVAVPVGDELSQQASHGHAFPEQGCEYELQVVPSLKNAGLPVAYFSQSEFWLQSFEPHMQPFEIP